MAQETRRPEPPLQALEVLGVHGPKVRDARPAGTWAKRTMRSANGALELEARPPAQGSDTFLQHQRQYGPNGSTPWSRSDRWPERLHEKRPLVNLSCVCTGESSGANVPYPKELCRHKVSSSNACADSSHFKTQKDPLFALQLYSHVHVHVHVRLPSRQDARPPVPWRHNVEGAEYNCILTEDRCVTRT